MVVSFGTEVAGEALNGIGIFLGFITWFLLVIYV